MPTNMFTGQKGRTIVVEDEMVGELEGAPPTRFIRPPTQQQTVTIKMNVNDKHKMVHHHTIAKWGIPSSTAAGTTTKNEKDSTNNLCRDGAVAELSTLSEGENFVTVSNNDDGTPHNNNISIVKGHQKLYIDNNNGHIKGSTAEYDGTSESVANETQKGDKLDNDTAVLCIDVDNIGNCVAVKDIRLNTSSDDNSNVGNELQFFIARKVISKSSESNKNKTSIDSQEKEKSNQQQEKEDGMSIDSDNTTSGYGTDDEKELNDNEVKEGGKYSPTKKEVDVDENGKLLYHKRELLPRRQLRVLQVGDRIILCQGSEVCYKLEYLSSTSTNNMATAVAPQEVKMGEEELDNTNNNSAESTKSYSSYLSGEVAVNDQDYVSGITTTDDRSSAENKEKEEVQVMKDAEKDDTSTKKMGGLKDDGEVGSGGATDDGKPSEKAPHEEIGAEVVVAPPLEVEYPEPDPDDTGKSQETGNFYTAAENQNTTEDDGDNDSDQELLSLTPADGKRNTAVKFEVDTNANEGSESDESGPDGDKTQAFPIPQNIKDKTEEQSFSSTADEGDKDGDDDSATTYNDDKNEEDDKKSSPPVDINMEDNTPTTHNLGTVEQLDDETTTAQNVKDKTDDQSNEEESNQKMPAANEDVGKETGPANLDISEPIKDRENEEQKMSDDDDTTVDEEGEGQMSSTVGEKELKLPANEKEGDDETTDGEGEGQQMAIDEYKQEEQVTAALPTKPDELPDMSKDDDETTVGDEDVAIEGNDQQQFVPPTNLDTQPETSNQEKKDDDDETAGGDEDMDVEDKKEPATAAPSTNLDTQPEASNHEEKDDDDTTVGDEEDMMASDEGDDKHQALSVPPTNLDTQPETSNQEEKDDDTTVGEEENDGDKELSANENEEVQLEEVPVSPALGGADKSKGEVKDDDSTVCDDEQQISPSAKQDSATEGNGNEEKESVNEDIEDSKDAPILNSNDETTMKEDTKDDDSTCDEDDRKMPANEDVDAPAETAEGDVGYDSGNVDNQATQGYPTMEPQPSPVKSYDVAKEDDDFHLYDEPTQQQSFHPEEVPSKPETQEINDPYNAETEPILQHAMQHDSPAKSHHSEEAEEEDDTERPQVQEEDLGPAANQSEDDGIDISSRKVDETMTSTSNYQPANDTEAVEERADDEQPEATSAASLKTTEEGDDQSTSAVSSKPQEESTTSNIASAKPEEEESLAKDTDSSQKSNDVDGKQEKEEEEEEEERHEKEESPKAKEDAPEEPIKSPSPDNKEPPEQQDAASDEEERTVGEAEEQEGEEVIDDEKEDLSTPKSSRTKRKRGAATTSTGKRKHDSGAIRIMFTGIEPSKKQLQMIDDIGAQLVSKIEDASTATHVIASDGKTKLRRTPKLMICLCKTDNILKLKWLEQSAKEQKVLDTSKYILNDKQAEKTYNFTMKETLKNGNEARLNNGGVLGGWYVYITKGVAGNKAPSAKEFQLLLSASGATQLTSLSESAVTNPEKTIMITNDPALAKQTSDKGVKRVTKLGGHVLTTTWLFNTFITQKASIDDDDEEEEEEIVEEEKGRKRKAATPSSGSNRKSSRRR